MLTSQRHPTLQPERSSLLVPAPGHERPHGGRSLDAATLDAMQSRFGQDFSSVRIHTDDDAARSAAARGTRAYSRGNDLVFATGRYSPATPDGQRLIAHELAHVAQQRAGGSNSGRGGDAESRAEAAAQQAIAGHGVDSASLGGVAPGIHCDGGGKDEKKEAQAAPRIESRPFFLPLSMLPLPQLQPPSLLQPPQRAPIFPIPQFNTGLAPGAGGGGSGMGFDTGSAVGKPPLFPPLLPGTAAGSGPLAPTAQPLSMPPLPAGKGNAGAGPDLPSRIGLTDFGPFNIGLRMGIPGPKTEIEGTPPDRRAQPPGQIPGSGPSALSVSQYQAELLHMSLTGKVPTGFDAIDKGELAKICFSILSTHIAPDLFKSLASKVGGKPGADYQIDFSLDVGSKAGALVFTMPLGKPPKVIPRSGTP